MSRWTLDWYRPDGPSGLDQVAETMAAVGLAGLLDGGGE